MPKKTSRFQSVRQWVWEHWFLSLGIVVIVVLLIFWTAKPISFAIFRLYAHDCGSVTSLGRQRSENGVQAQQVENCFLQNYHQCQAAILTYTDMGVDTSDTYTFTVSNTFGRCSLTDNGEYNGLGRTGGATYTCSDLIQKSDGLHFLACGNDGEIIVPGP